MIKKILSSSVLLLIGNIFGRLAVFVINIIAARLLPQEIFGQYTMLRSTASMLENILTGSIGSVIVKKTAESTNNKNNLSNMLISILILNITFVAVLSLIILINTDTIIKYFFIDTKLIHTGFLLSILILIISILSLSLQKIFIGLEIYKKFAITSTIVSVISILFSWFSIKYFNFYGIFYAIIFYFFIDFIFKFILIKNFFILKEFNFNLVIKNIKNFLLFSYPILLSVIVSAFSFWYSKVLVLKSTGQYSQIGIYDAAYQWLTIIMIITGATTSVALPMLSKVINTKESKKIFFTNLIVNLLISSLIAFLFIVYSKEIMSIYGKEFIKGAEILSILSITSIFFTLSSLFNKFVISIEHKWIIFLNIILSTFVLFIVLFNFINLQIYALAYSLLSFYISSCFIYLIYISIKIKKGYNL